jgi:dGTPase
MFDSLVAEPSRLPAKFARIAGTEGVHRAVGDYLAGMTDRFAFKQHRRLTTA